MLLLWPLSVYISTLKWKTALEHYRINIKFHKLFDLYLVGSFFNNFLPTSIGGDSYKFLFLNKKIRGKKAQILSSIIIDRGFGFLTLIMFGLFSGIFFIKKYYQSYFSISSFFLIIFLILLVFLLFFTGFQIKQNFGFSIINKAIKLVNVILSFRDTKKIFLLVLYSFFFLLIGIFSIYICFLAFNYKISILVLFFIIPLINLSELFPFSINSLGIKEGFGIYLMSIFNIDITIGLAVLLTSRSLVMFGSLIGGIRYLQRKY